MERVLCKALQECEQAAALGAAAARQAHAEERAQWEEAMRTARQEWRQQAEAQLRAASEATAQRESIRKPLGSVHTVLYACIVV